MYDSSLLRPSDELHDIISLLFLLDVVLGNLTVDGRVCYSYTANAGHGRSCCSHHIIFTANLSETCSFKFEMQCCIIMFVVCQLDCYRLISVILLRT